MGIVLINHYAGDGKNGMEYRPYLMARRWVEAGEEVTIVASSFTHLRSKNPEMEGMPIREEMVDGIRYVWIKGNSYQGNGLGRIRNMLSFLLGLYRFESRIVQDNCKAVIASSTYPLDIYPARRMARKRGAKFIFELHDMWPLSPVELGGMSPNHPYIRVMQKAEDDWCRTADEVVSLLPAAKPYLVEHGMKPDKFHYIPNGVEGFAGAEKYASGLPLDHCSRLSALRKRGLFLVGYAGTIGLANGLDMLLDAVSLADEKVGAVLLGDGPERQRLENRAKELGLLNERVVFMPPVPKQSVPVFLSMVDAAFISLQPQPLFRFGVSPNKMMDYMMAAKPIVSAIDAANDYVVEAECGFTIPSGNPSQIAQAFNCLAEMSEDALRALGEKGRRYIVENNDYDVLARKFLDVIGS